MSKLKPLHNKFLAQFLCKSQPQTQATHPWGDAPTHPFVAIKKQGKAGPTGQDEGGLGGDVDLLQVLQRLGVEEADGGP